MPEFTAGYCTMEIGCHLWLAAPTEEFNVVPHQLGFLGDRFIPYAMPEGYVYDFLLCPPGTLPPPWASDGTNGQTARRTGITTFGVACTLTCPPVLWFHPCWEGVNPDGARGVE
jgi:hypothetical protein